MSKQDKETIALDKIVVSKETLKAYLEKAADSQPSWFLFRMLSSTQNELRELQSLVCSVRKEAEQTAAENYRLKKRLVALAAKVTMLESKCMERRDSNLRIVDQRQTP